jgi:hypothetical protein
MKSGPDHNVISKLIGDDVVSLFNQFHAKSSEAEDAPLSSAYGKGWPWTHENIATARFAQHVYILRAGHP